MPLLISLGSNQGNKISYLNEAREKLESHLEIIAKSRIYESSAVDFTEQPDFYNQVLEFRTPLKRSAQDILEICLSIEKDMGRVRLINKGPRTIDIDILFWDNAIIESETLTVPHPRLFQRSFIVRPLKELPCFSSLSKNYSFKDSFEVEASPIANIPCLKEH